MKYNSSPGPLFSIAHILGQSVPALMPGLANLCFSMSGITTDVREL